MELRVLRYFLAVAREQNISAAAAYLHVTQPTLSRQLIELEEELGTKLFTRGKRKIVLTNEGILLRKRAEEIDDLVQKTKMEITSSNKFVSGDIYIGGGETHAMGLLAGLISDVQAEHPDVRVHIYSGNAEDVTERLDKGLLDFGLLIQPCDVSGYNSLHLSINNMWGVLMRKDSPLAAKRAIRPEDLWSVPLIASRQRLVEGDVGRWIGKDFENLNIVATYNLVYNASVMVEKGIGYALTLDKLVNTTGNSVLCFKPLKPKLEARVDVVWKKYQVFSKAADIFLQKIEQAFGPAK